MPHFSFELHVVITKFGEKPVHMTKRVMDIYISIYIELAYNMAKSYIEKGWVIDRAELRDFRFLDNDPINWNE